MRKITLAITIVIATIFTAGQAQATSTFGSVPLAEDAPATSENVISDVVTALSEFVGGLLDSMDSSCTTPDPKKPKKEKTKTRGTGTSGGHHNNNGSGTGNTNISGNSGDIDININININLFGGNSCI